MQRSGQDPSLPSPSSFFVFPQGSWTPNPNVLGLFQEPLLYRCSLTVRMASTYLNTKGIRASKVHLDLLFPKLDFSLSDQQVPMFIRLAKLALALHMGDLHKGRPDKVQPPDVEGDAQQSADGSNDPERAPADDDQDQDQEESSGGQSWAGWAWGYVPSILPVYWEEEVGGDGSADVLSERERVVRFGLYVDRLTWTFKWAETVRDGGAISSAASGRLKFTPFLTLRLQGSYVEGTLDGVERVSVQGGMSHVTLEPASPYCLCGWPEEVSLYFLQGCERTSFLRQSLYSVEPLEDQTPPLSVQDRRDWDLHVQSVTEATLLERTPALGFDFLYQLELPEENGSDYLSKIGSEGFLEYSDLPERALFRLAVGPAQLKASYGFCHRISALIQAVQRYNYYPDYGAGQQLLLARKGADASTSSPEEIPTRVYQVAVLRPLIFVSLWPPHPSGFDLARLVERRTIRPATGSLAANLKSRPAAPLPVLRIALTCADLRVVQPMYPARLSLMARTDESLLAHCHTDGRMKLTELTVELVAEDKRAGLLKPCNASVRMRSLLLPELWKEEPDKIRKFRSFRLAGPF